MAYIFAFFAGIIIVVIILLLLIGWTITKNKIFGKLIGIVILGVVGVILLGAILRLFTSKKELTKSDLYGTYIIDRTKFPGKQADWQYNHYRFDITRQNEFLFYETDQQRIIRTFKGAATVSPFYKVPRLILQIDSPSNHIIVAEPTLYRTIWSFYYVFHSPKFGNVFFKKGKCKKID